MRRVLLSALTLAALGSGAGIGELRPMLNPPVKPVGLEAHDTHAAMSLLGQFRTGISSWMFLRADLYLHNGVEMRPLSKGEIAAGRRGVGTSEAREEQLHDDSKVVTVIPGADRDFRGVLGDLERAGSTYRDMSGHSHNDPAQSLPLFRLMTLLDPQFVEGWTTGASIIVRDRNLPAAKRARAFLLEGLDHNPQSVEILGAIGKLYLTRFVRIEPDGKIIRDYAHARPWYERAFEITWKNREFLSENEREAARENLRFHVFILRDLRDPQCGEKVRRALEILPDDPLLRRMAQPFAPMRR